MCRIHKILIALASFTAWKSVLISAHAERCPRCAAELKAGDRLIREALNPDWIARGPGLWPRVLAGIEAKDAASLPSPPAQMRAKLRPAASRRKWLWAPASTLAVSLAIMAGVWLVVVRNGRREAPKGESPTGRLNLPAAAAPRVQVFSAEVGGKRAKTYIYQTPKALFIWIAPSKEIGG
jgi:hypothetical protein